MRGQTVLSYESPSSRMSRLGGNTVLGDDRTLDEVLDRFDAVDAGRGPGRGGRAVRRRARAGPGRSPGAARRCCETGPDVGRVAAGRQEEQDMTKVAVFGARGKMGAEVCRAVEGADDLELVAAVDAGDDRSPAEAADVAVDFTHPDAVMDNLAWCVAHGVHAVVGTTGFDDARLERLRDLLADARRSGCWSPPTSPSAPC